jgi:hypothetical protein
LSRINGHLGQREPVVQPATLGIIVILRGRFLWARESEKGREVTREG